MARISGIDLPRNKKIEIALTSIYGISLKSSQLILRKVNINPNIRTRDLEEDKIIKLREYIEKGYQTEGDLRKLETLNIKRLIDINCYKGRRHRLSLPVRGQRTKTNARTRRGSKKTVAGRKKAK